MKAFKSFIMKCPNPKCRKEHDLMKLPKKDNKFICPDCGECVANLN